MTAFCPSAGRKTRIFGTHGQLEGDSAELRLFDFRTDQWDWPESDDPTEILLSRAEANERKKEAAERGIFRRTEEAKRAVEILERVQKLGQEQ